METNRIDRNKQIDIFLHKMLSNAQVPSYKPLQVSGDIVASLRAMNNIIEKMVVSDKEILLLTTIQTHMESLTIQ